MFRNMPSYNRLAIARSITTTLQSAHGHDEQSMTSRLLAICFKSFLWNSCRSRKFVCIRSYKGNSLGKRLQIALGPAKVQQTTMFWWHNVWIQICCLCESQKALQTCRSTSGNEQTWTQKLHRMVHLDQTPTHVEYQLYALALYVKKTPILILYMCPPSSC